MPAGAVQGAYLFFLAWLLAYVEIQVEGPHGWATSLPTWRWENPLLLKLTNGKPVTGYHVSLIGFALAAFHLPLVEGGWSLAREAGVLSAYALFAVCWDFQWFVWNPAWGPARYFRERVWWLPKRVLRLPVEYYLGLIASAGLAAVAGPHGLAGWTGEAAAALVLSASSAAIRATSKAASGRPSSVARARIASSR